MVRMKSLYIIQRLFFSIFHPLRYGFISFNVRNMYECLCEELNLRKVLGNHKKRVANVCLNDCSTHNVLDAEYSCRDSDFFLFHYQWRLFYQVEGTHS